jgi:hypothetical protein
MEMSMMIASIMIGGLLACCAPVEASLSNDEQQAEELGLVRWERDHDQAFVRARQADKPVLLLFQEIPG